MATEQMIFVFVTVRARTLGMSYKHLVGTLGTIAITTLFLDEARSGNKLRGLHIPLSRISNRGA